MSAAIEKARYSNELRVRINGSEWIPLEELSVRGQHCLKAIRLCFGIEASERIEFRSLAGERPISFRRLNLVSLSQDMFYFRSELGYSVMERLDHFHLGHQYVELIVNGQTQGLYLAIEKPRSKLKRSPFYSPFIARTTHDARIEPRTFESDNTTLDEEVFLDALAALETGIRQLRGRELYDFLTPRLDIDRYLEILALFYIFRNGDYVDEFYVYAVSKNGMRRVETAESIYFRFLPWDLDQLFDGPKRTYQARLGLLYDRRTPLDRKIRRNKFLYLRYRRSFLELLEEKLTEAVIEEEFDQLRRRIRPYLTDRILEPSRWDRRRDRRPYSRDAIMEAIDLKQSFSVAHRQITLDRLRSELQTENRE